jgi:hypothetical protein
MTDDSSWDDKGKIVDDYLDWNRKQIKAVRQKGNRLFDRAN